MTESPDEKPVSEETPSNSVPSVDLSAYELPPPRTPEFLSINEAEAFERTIRGRQEWVRTALAVGAFLSLVAILLVLLLSVIKQITTDNIEKVSAVVVTPLTGIVGTIIGFYFAEKRGGNSDGDMRPRR